MVNEAVLLRQYSIPIQYTCADGVGIEKGTILKLTDPNTAALSTAATDMIAGICASEKIASNGITKVAVHRDGEFKVYCSGSVAVGTALSSCVSDGNYVAAAAVTASGSCVLGYALETATAGETFRMRLHIGAGGGIA